MRCFRKYAVFCEVVVIDLQRGSEGILKLSEFRQVGIILMCPSCECVTGCAVRIIRGAAPALQSICTWSCCKRDERTYLGLGNA